VGRHRSRGWCFIHANACGSGRFPGRRPLGPGPGQLYREDPRFAQQRVGPSDPQLLPSRGPAGTPRRSRCSQSPRQPECSRCARRRPSQTPLGPPPEVSGAPAAVLSTQRGRTSGRTPTWAWAAAGRRPPTAASPSSNAVAAQNRGTDAAALRPLRRAAIAGRGRLAHAAVPAHRDRRPLVRPRRRGLQGQTLRHLTASRALGDDGPIHFGLVVEGSEEQGTGGLEAYVTQASKP
jgi:hypothetical protein